MATSPKPKSPAKRTRALAPSRKSPESSVKSSEPSAKPFLRFYHSVELRVKTLCVLDAIEQAEDATAHRDDLVEVTLELMDSALDYYFLKPLKLTKAGFITEQSAKLGLAGTQQVMGSVIRNIIGRMDAEQLLSVCASIRRLMH